MCCRMLVHSHVWYYSCDTTYKGDPTSVLQVRPETMTRCHTCEMDDMLQCVAARCSVLPRVAACCSALQHVAACCSVLQRAAESWINHTCDMTYSCRWHDLQRRPTIRRALQCVAMCNKCVAVCCSVLQCVAVCCSVLQCVAQWLIRTCDTTCRRDIHYAGWHRVSQCVAGCCSVLQCVAVCCRLLQTHSYIFVRVESTNITHLG